MKPSKSWFRQILRQWIAISVSRKLIKIVKNKPETSVIKLLKTYKLSYSNGITSSNINKDDTLQLTYKLLELNGFSLTYIDFYNFFEKKEEQIRKDGYDLIFYVLNQVGIQTNITKNDLIKLFNCKNRKGNGYIVSEEVYNALNINKWNIPISKPISPIYNVFQSCIDKYNSQIAKQDSLSLTLTDGKTNYYKPNIPVKTQKDSLTLTLGPSTDYKTASILLELQNK